MYEVYSDYLFVHLSFNREKKFFFFTAIIRCDACTWMMDRVRVAAAGLENTAEKFVQERKGRGGIKVKVSGIRFLVPLNHG